MKKIKCYCGHTDYCDCGEIEPQVTTSNMKLYTEEDLLKAIQLGRNYGGLVTTEPEILKQLTPIELPSDEEIGEATRTKSLWDCSYETNFRLGAKWMKEQILNQNK